MHTKKHPRYRVLSISKGASSNCTEEKKEELFSKDPESFIPAERDYIAVYQNEPQLVPNYQVKWNSILQEETLGEVLPQLAQGKISAEEFTRREDESIQEFLEEQ